MLRLLLVLTIAEVCAFSTSKYTNAIADLKQHSHLVSTEVFCEKPCGIDPTRTYRVVPPTVATMTSSNSATTVGLIENSTHVVRTQNTVIDLSPRIPSFLPPSYKLCLSEPQCPQDCTQAFGYVPSIDGTTVRPHLFPATIQRSAMPSKSTGLQLLAHRSASSTAAIAPDSIRWTINFMVGTQLTGEQLTYSEQCNCTVLAPTVQTQTRPVAISGQTQGVNGATTSALLNGAAYTVQTITYPMVYDLDAGLNLTTERIIADSGRIDISTETAPGSGQFVSHGVVNLILLCESNKVQNPSPTLQYHPEAGVWFRAILPFAKARAFANPNILPGTVSMDAMLTGTEFVNASSVRYDASAKAMVFDWTSAAEAICLLDVAANAPKATLQFVQVYYTDTVVVPALQPTSLQLDAAKAMAVPLIHCSVNGNKLWNGANASCLVTMNGLNATIATSALAISATVQPAGGVGCTRSETGLDLTKSHYVSDPDHLHTVQFWVLFPPVQYEAEIKITACVADKCGAYRFDGRFPLELQAIETHPLQALVTDDQLRDGEAAIFYGWPAHQINSSAVQESVWKFTRASTELTMQCALSRTIHTTISCTSKNATQVAANVLEPGIYIHKFPWITQNGDSPLECNGNELLPVSVTFLLVVQNGLLGITAGPAWIDTELIAESKKDEPSAVTTIIKVLADNSPSAKEYRKASELGGVTAVAASVVIVILAVVQIKIS
jgi:hypothetical protein